MRSSFDALEDETRPLHLLDEQSPAQPARDRYFVGAVLSVLAVLVPVLVIVAL